MNILIVKLYPLSEVINALPTINIIKKFYNANITLVTHEFFFDFVDLLEDVDYKVLYPENELKSSNRKKYKESLHKYRYDMIIDLEGSMESALVCKKALRKPKTKIFGPSFQREGAFKLYDHISGTRNIDRHPEIQCMDILKYLEIPISCSQIKYKLNMFDQYNNYGNFILISIDSHHPKKYINYEMCSKIIKNYSSNVIIIGKDKSLENVEELEDYFSEDKVKILFKKLSLIQRIELLYRSSYCYCAHFDNIQLLSFLNKDGCMINMNNKKLAHPTYQNAKIINQEDFDSSENLYF